MAVFQGPQHEQYQPVQFTIDQESPAPTVYRGWGLGEVENTWDVVYVPAQVLLDIAAGWLAAGYPGDLFAMLLGDRQPVERRSSLGQELYRLGGADLTVRLEDEPSEAELEAALRAAPDCTSCGLPAIDHEERAGACPDERGWYHATRPGASRTLAGATDRAITAENRRLLADPAAVAHQRLESEPMSCTIREPHPLGECADYAPSEAELAAVPVGAGPISTASPEWAAATCPHCPHERHDARCQRAVGLVQCHCTTSATDPLWPRGGRPLCRECRELPVYLGGLCGACYAAEGARKRAEG